MLSFPCFTLRKTNKKVQMDALSQQLLQQLTKGGLSQISQQIGKLLQIAAPPVLPAPGIPPTFHGSSLTIASRIMPLSTASRRQLVA